MSQSRISVQHRVIIIMEFVPGESKSYLCTAQSQSHISVQHRVVIIMGVRARSVKVVSLYSTESLSSWSSCQVSQSRISVQHSA